MVPGVRPEHLLGLHADLKHLLLAVRHFLHRDNRWFTHHDSLPLQINQGVGGAKVDGQIIGKHSEQIIKHFQHYVVILSVIISSG